MKQLVKCIIIYLLVCFSFFLLFVCLFKTTIFSDQPVLFYRGLSFLIIQVVFYLLSGLYFTKKEVVFAQTYFSSVALATSLTLTYFVLVPVTSDRSISVFLLKTLSTSSLDCRQGINRDSLDRVFLQNYVRENHAITRRINEQLFTGSIRTSNKCIQLTKKGALLVRFFDLNTMLFGISHGSLSQEPKRDKQHK